MLKDSLPVQHQSDTASEMIVINDDSEVNEMCCFCFGGKGISSSRRRCGCSRAPRLPHVRVRTNFCVRQHKNIIIVQLCMRLGVG